MRAGDNSASLSEVGSGDSHHSDHGVFGATLTDHRDVAASNGASTPRGDFIQSPFGLFTCNNEKFASKTFKDSCDGKPAIHKVLTSKAEEWMVKKGLSWPWKGNDQEGSKGRPTDSIWPWVQNEQEKEKSHQINPSADVKSESHAFESNKPINNEASSLWSSSINANRTNSDQITKPYITSVSRSERYPYVKLWGRSPFLHGEGDGTCRPKTHFKDPLPCDDRRDEN